MAITGSLGSIRLANKLDSDRRKKTSVVSSPTDRMVCFEGTKCGKRHVMKTTKSLVKVHLKKNSSQREIIKNYFVNKKLKETPRNIQEKIINKIKAIK